MNRDEQAHAFALALIARPDVPHDETATYVAERAYALADAMDAARRGAAVEPEVDDRWSPWTTSDGRRQPDGPGDKLRIVFVRLRSGGEMSPRSIGAYGWNHTGGPGDIVAYRYA